MTSLLRAKFSRILVPVFAICFFLSCQKNSIDDLPNNITPTPPDLVTKVVTSLSGFVMNENNAPVQGATVNAGGNIAISDRNGFFEFKNILMVKDVAVVTVTQTGYFKAIKTYATKAGKSAFFRIKLIPRIVSGSVSSTTGGDVTLAGGVIVHFPADAVVNASTNVAYSGTIRVAAHWLDPTAADLWESMPGDLRAIDNSGSLTGLKSFGMTGVELTGTSGESLQLAPGKKATLTFPLPSAVQSAAPATIPLWYFDEAVGLWKEDGTATKTGNTYVGDVSHFTWWNCDLPNAIVPLTFTIVDGNGNPMSNVNVDITPSTPGAWGHIVGWTDASGYASLFVTPNTDYTLNASGGCSVGVYQYSQNFSVGTSAVALGNIIMPTGSSMTITGTVTDCNNNPVANGYIIVNGNYQATYIPVTNGSYNFSTLLCGSSNTFTIYAYDRATGQQSPAITYNLIQGPNNIGNLQACGITTQKFINYSIDGTNYSLVAPIDSVYHTGFGSTLYSAIGGMQWGTSFGINFSMNNTGIGLNSSQPLNGTVTINGMQMVPSGSINVAITEYGAVGEYIAGNFTGICVTQQPPIVNHTVTCSFRVQRSF